MLQLRKVLRVTGLRPICIEGKLYPCTHCHGILCSSYFYFFITILQDTKIATVANILLYPITLYHEFPQLSLAIDVTSGGTFFQTASLMPDRVKEAFYGSVLSTVFSPPYTHTAPSDMLDQVTQDFYAPQEYLQGNG